jgi:ABC-type taurine transport system substrate-binding protein
MTRRTLWLSSLSVAAIGSGARAATDVRRDDTVRYGTVIGAVGAPRMVLPGVEKNYGLKYDVKDFRDSTSRLLALSQGELDIASTTSQHLVRAISEGIDVAWISGWGGGNNVFVARKNFDLKAMAKELRNLGWVKEDYSDRIDKHLDFTFLAKATGRSPAQLSTW